MPSFITRVTTTLLLTTLVLSGCNSPPQVVQDEQCFKAVDALWTAVSARRPELIDQTAEELDRLHQDGTLSDEGHAELSKIIDLTRTDQWSEAAQSLKTFMLGQRKTRT